MADNSIGLSCHSILWTAFFLLKTMNNFSKSREKRVFFSTIIEQLLVSLCFLKEEHNVVYKSNVWFLLQSAYDSIFLLGGEKKKKVIPNQLNWSLHSLEFYFQAIMCLEIHLALQIMLSMSGQQNLYLFSQLTVSNSKDSHWDSIQRDKFLKLSEVHQWPHNVILL